MWQFGSSAVMGNPYQHMAINAISSPRLPPNMNLNLNVIHPINSANLGMKPPSFNGYPAPFNGMMAPPPPPPSSSSSSSAAMYPHPQGPLNYGYPGSNINNVNNMAIPLYRPNTAANTRPPPSASAPQPPQAAFAANAPYFPSQAAASQQIANTNADTQRGRTMVRNDTLGKAKPSAAAAALPASGNSGNNGNNGNNNGNLPIRSNSPMRIIAAMNQVQPITTNSSSNSSSSVVVAAAVAVNNGSNHNSNQGKSNFSNKVTPVQQQQLLLPHEEEASNLKNSGSDSSNLSIHSNSNHNLNNEKRNGNEIITNNSNNDNNNNNGDNVVPAAAVSNGLQRRFVSSSPRGKLSPSNSLLAAAAANSVNNSINNSNNGNGNRDSNHSVVRASTPDFDAPNPNYDLEIFNNVISGAGGGTYHRQMPISMQPQFESPSRANAPSGNYQSPPVSPQQQQQQQQQQNDTQSPFHQQHLYSLIELEIEDSGKTKKELNSLHPLPYPSEIGSYFYENKRPDQIPQHHHTYDTYPQQHNQQYFHHPSSSSSFSAAPQSHNNYNNNSNSSNYYNYNNNNNNNNNNMMIPSHLHQQNNTYTNNSSSNNSANPSNNTNSIRRVGNYSILDTVGKGGASTVQIAIHEPTGLYVAIKTFEKSKEAKGKFVPDWKHVQHELSILRELEHENIVTTYELMQTKNRIYYVMEYCEGGDLYNYCMNNGGLRDDNFTKTIFLQMVRAVMYIHSCGYVHRDIKAGNILLTQDLRVKLADFGIATKYVETKTGTNEEYLVEMTSSFQSLHYAAPETLNCKPYFGTGVDVWALGVLLYFMVMECFPFTGKYHTDVKRAIEYGKFTIDNKRMSNELQLFLRSILVGRPERRPSLTDVLRMPWLASVVSSYPPEIKPKPVEENMDSEIVQDLVNAGMGTAYHVIRDIKRHMYTDIDATYRLFLKRKKLDSISSSSSSSSSSFHNNNNNNSNNNNNNNNYNYNNNVSNNNSNSINTISNSSSSSNIARYFS